MPLSGHNGVALFNEVAQTLNQHKNLKIIIIASLKSESVGKLINRIPGLRPLISSLPGLALRMHAELLGKPHNVNNRSPSLAW